MATATLTHPRAGVGSRIFGNTLTWLGALLLLSTAAQAAPAATNDLELILTFPVSVFEDATNNPAAKDPFFPNSTRRVLQEPVPVIPTNIVVPTLTLRGITGPPERRIALINTRTFEKGEEAEIKVSPTERLQIKVVDIQDDRVIVSFKSNGDDEQKTLKLEDEPLSLVPPDAEAP